MSEYKKILKEMQDSIEKIPYPTEQKEIELLRKAKQEGWEYLRIMRSGIHGKHPQTKEYTYYVEYTYE